MREKLFITQKATNCCQKRLHFSAPSPVRRKERLCCIVARLLNTDFLLVRRSIARIARYRTCGLFGYFSTLALCVVLSWGAFVRIGRTNERLAVFIPRSAPLQVSLGGTLACPSSVSFYCDSKLLIINEEAKKDSGCRRG